ncbi:MAG: hypothetical protein IPP72_10085 [Chitinophagaceae bacterium]|nr:hypothetical protein [Chitinophagaceae bacterium]
MFRYLLFFVMIIHGLIHLMGFAKAFGYANITQLTKHISRPMGAFWFVAAILFIAAAVILLIKKDMWWITALVAIAVSQVLIISSWQDAKFGTIANALVLLAIVAVYGSRHFENSYQLDVAESFHRSSKIENDLLTENDVSVLPPLVQQYIRYTGMLNKPKIKNMQLVFDGEMRERGKDWFPFVSEQHDFFDEPTRLFFMKARMYGMTVPGYHAYKNAMATMQIKLFGLIPIVDKRGNEMNKAETVTLFNDMCIFAPAVLIDKRIRWEAIDSSSIKAVFTNHGISISAMLQFNAAGQLVNFISDDRYDISAKNQYRFSTPVSEYKNINGFKLATYGETVWHYPEGNFIYGKFHLGSIEYNKMQ